MTLVSDIHYFAPYIFYLELNKYKHCIFDQYELYQKMSFRNRCTLSGGNRPVQLSIPLDGGRGQKAPMKDVRILNKEKWQERHWKTITSCYNKSPYFGHFKDELEELYKRKFGFLVDWNLACFNWAADKLAIKTPATLSEGYQVNYDKSEFVDWRNYMLPSTINQKFPAARRYPQVFEERFGFIPNLSILDYLFCMGTQLE